MTGRNERHGGRLLLAEGTAATARIERFPASPAGQAFPEEPSGLTDLLPCLLFVAERGRIRYANLSMLAYAGLKRDEAHPGRELDDLAGQIFQTVLHNGLKQSASLSGLAEMLSAHGPAESRIVGLGRAIDRGVSPFLASIRRLPRGAGPRGQDAARLVCLVELPGAAAPGLDEPEGPGLEASSCPDKGLPWPLFLRELEEEITRACRYGSPLSMIAFAVDGFESLPAESRGRLPGALTALLAQHTRSIDCMNHDGRGRFLLSQPQTTLYGAMCTADKLRGLIEDYAATSAPGMTCSFGATAYITSETAEEFCRRAEETLDKARESGPGRIAATAPQFLCVEDTPLESSFMHDPHGF